MLLFIGSRVFRFSKLCCAYFLALCAQRTAIRIALCLSSLILRSLCLSKFYVSLNQKSFFAVPASIVVWSQGVFVTSALLCLVIRVKSGLPVRWLRCAPSATKSTTCVTSVADCIGQHHLLTRNECFDEAKEFRFLKQFDSCVRLGSKISGFDGVSFECFLVHDLCTSLIFWLKFSMFLHSVYCSLVALCAILSSVLRLQVWWPALWTMSLDFLSFFILHVLFIFWVEVVVRTGGANLLHR